MAQCSQLPCDGDGICMLCKQKPSVEETLTCKTCITPWHVNCISNPPETLALTIQWECPDCSSLTSDPNPIPVTGSSSSSGELIAAIRAIEADESLTELEKAKRRQKLLSGASGSDDVNDEDESKKKKKSKNGDKDVLAILDEKFNCSFCMQLPERPVTTPCGHNFCLKCFEKWIAQRKRTCAKCRSPIPAKMASQPRINSALVVAIRMAKTSRNNSSGYQGNVYQYMQNQNRPDQAFTTERAKKAGRANASSGKIFVTVAPDYFGPILAENDPIRNQGVLVGETWVDRMDCRQWGAHLPHVAGIAGQAEHGAQSVALSGGYQDDEDHGEWFLYTGSGGRDLSNNKRTNKDQCKDQVFESGNEALRLSCRKGYPVRVVRSHKEKRSAYAPEKGVRYDGVYRIEKCWRKTGIQGFIVCRYLFVRCDNEPAPWTSDEHGDRPRPLPVINELKEAIDITERKSSPFWDYDEEEGIWKWTRPQPPSKKPVVALSSGDKKKARRAIRKAQKLSVTEKLLKEFSCPLCKKVMTLPVTTPCAHNFCKACLEGVFAGQTFVKERVSQGGRRLRSRKAVMKCPSCPTDISDFLKSPQVNRELEGVIESLQSKTEENAEEPSEDGSGKSENSAESGEAGTEDIQQDEPSPEAENDEPEQNKRQKTEGSEFSGNDSPSSPLHVGSKDDISE